MIFLFLFLSFPQAKRKEKINPCFSFSKHSIPAQSQRETMSSEKGFPKRKSSSLPILKGDIAPSSYKLMKIDRAGKMKTEVFSSSPFAFTRIAYQMLLHDPHYNIDDVAPKYVFDPKLGKSGLDATPDSIKYERLVHEMKNKNLVQAIALESVIAPVVVLRLFAVVKETAFLGSPGLARPIENGRPVKPKKDASSGFSLAGATQMLLLLLDLASEGMSAYHYDYSNYYFQIKNYRPRDHVFRIGNQLWEWLVTTMGWFKATFIAQALTIHMAVDGCIDVAETFSSLTSPPGIIRLTNGGAIVCIYDSVVIFDKIRFLKHHQKRVVENSRKAYALLKYEIIQPLNESFVWCGFEFLPLPCGLSWRVNPETLVSWKVVFESVMDATPRTLWKILGLLSFIWVILELPKRLLGPGRHMQGNIGLVDAAGWDVVDNRISMIFAWAKTTFESVNNVFRHRRTRRIPRDVLRFAADATLVLWGWYQLDEEGSIIDECGGAFPQNGEIWTIDECEAYAAAQAICKADEINPNALLILAGDNIPVEQAFDKGSSQKPQLYFQIQRARVDQNARVLLLADVTTDENVADIKTRPSEVYTFEEVALRKSQTSTRMSLALRHWLLHGSTFFSRHSERNVAIDDLSAVEDQEPPTDDDE